MFSIKKPSRSGNKLPILSSVFVVMLLCVSGAFVMANTDNGSDAAINATDGLDYTVTDGCLTISGTGPMQDYTSTVNLGTLYSFTTCIIGSGVTTIGDIAFYNCNNLSSVTISDTVTHIGNHAFYGCTNLISVIIPISVTFVEDEAFDIPTLTTMYCAGCPEWEADAVSETVTSISYNVRCTVSFDIGSATSATAPTSQTIPIGSCATDPDLIVEGYTVAWYSDSGFTTQFDYSTAITSDMTVYLKLTADSYIVTFDIGSASVTAPSSQTITSGSCATEPDLTVDGFIVAWYSDADLTAPFDYTVGIMANTTVYLGLTAISVDPTDPPVTNGDQNTNSAAITAVILIIFVIIAIYVILRFI